MRILVWIVGGIGIGVVAALLLGRFAVLAGMILILLGVGPMAALFFYTEIAEPTRDMSTEGMFSTLILIMATPFGITVFLTGLLRRE